MEKNNVRTVALKLLDEYEAAGKYVNLSLSSHLTNGMSRDERAFLTVLFYTSVEHKLTYDYMISALAGRSIGDIDLHTKNILRLGLCQILHTSVADHAAVNETVKLCRNKGERGFVNALLREAVRAKDENRLPMPDRKKSEARYLSVYHSFPLPVVKLFIELLGEEECDKLLSVFNSVGYTDLTVNTRRISRAELQSRFAEDGIDSVASTRSTLSLRVEGSVDPRSLYGFSEGLFFVQDEICSASVEVLGVSRGEVVIDVCASPGGKSFAAAVLLEEGTVYSFDLHQGRVSLIKEGAQRLGLDCVRPSVRDAMSCDESLVGKADRVICDVPCSGLGVLGKKPDLRYKDRDSYSDLPAIQYSILESASQYLRIGGTMVYSTCTLDPKENGDVVSRFLAEHPQFSAVDFSVGDERSFDGCFTAYPHRHNCDGFFIAKLMRNY